MNNGQYSDFSDVSKEKAAYAERFIEILKNNEDTRLNQTISDPGSGLIIEVFANHKINIKQYPEYSNENSWKVQCVELLKPVLKDIYPRHYEEFDKTDIVNLNHHNRYKLPMVMEELSKNIDEIEGFKEQIIKIARLLENGEDVTAYCLSFKVDE